MDHASSEMEAIQNTWEQICDKFPVPKSLYRHQKDTIALLLRGESVFCGSPTGRAWAIIYLCTVTGLKIGLKFELKLTIWKGKKWLPTSAFFGEGKYLRKCWFWEDKLGIWCKIFFEINGKFNNLTCKLENQYAEHEKLELET